MSGPKNRINQLRQLEDGWYDGRGKKLSSNALTWLESVCAQHEIGNIPFPYFYPTVSGGARAEWPISNWEASAEFHNENEAMFFHAVNIDSGDEVVQTINSIDELCVIIKTLGKVTAS